MEAEVPELQSCLARVQLGDEDAARQLVTLLHPLVMKIVRSHLPRRTAEDDLVQEVFARVFQRLDRYEAREGIPFEHWVSRLAVRTCLDALRSERRRPEWRRADLTEREEEWLDFLLDEGAAAPTAGSAGGADATTTAARELVELLMERLSAEDRLVLRLLDLEERSAAEVGQLTGWSSVGVRVRAFRARGRLRHVAKELRLERNS